MIPLGAGVGSLSDSAGAESGKAAPSGLVVFCACASKWYEPRDANQIVGDEVEQEVACDAMKATMPGLAHRAMLLAPTEDALDHCPT